MRHLDLRTYPRYIIYKFIHLIHRSSFIIHRSMSYILHPATINPHMYMYARIQHIVKTSMSAADIPSELTLRRDVQHAGFWMSIVRLSMDIGSPTDRASLPCVVKSSMPACRHPAFICVFVAVRHMIAHQLMLACRHHSCMASHGRRLSAHPTCYFCSLYNIACRSLHSCHA